MTTYTGSFENFTRTFFFEPDQQIETLFDQSNEVLKLRGSKSSKNTLSNNKNFLKSLTLNFTNRTQKETQCILHFLESHLGYKTFFYNFNNSLITKNKISNKSATEALNFHRVIKENSSSNIYHHFGIYLYKYSALKKFVNFKKSENETKEKLEQLRAIDNNMKINVILAKYFSSGIDTKKDLEDYIKSFKK